MASRVSFGGVGVTLRVVIYDEPDEHGECAVVCDRCFIDADEVAEAESNSVFSGRIRQETDT